MDLSKLQELLAGEPAYRLAQARRAIFTELAEDWELVTGLPKPLRQKLSTNCPLSIDAQLSVSSDKNTYKALIMLADGNAIEAVLMRHENRRPTGEEGSTEASRPNVRNTLCVSCMVGCPMGCTFCATGAMGLARRLTTDEIIVQALFFARILKKENERIDSVVFMGMGEPLQNYDNVMAAVRQLQSPDGFNIGFRHISISTCGILDGMRKLAAENIPVNLAVSLHASNDAIRLKLMPIARGYSIKELLAAVDEYILRTKRKVMFEYLMINGVNDLDGHALELAKLVRNKLTFVNLIRYNPTGVTLFEPSSSKQMDRFKKILEQNGVTVTMRYRFGTDIKGACGQLAVEKKLSQKK